MDARFFVAENACKRLDIFLSEQMEDCTRSRIKKLIESGNVTVNNCAQTKAGAMVAAGDGVRVVVPEAVEYHVQAENIPLDIVYEDDDLAVVNKPKGMVVHVGNGVEKGTLVNALMYALDKLSGIGGVLRPGIVHRIDKDTTGLLVVAKNDKSHVSLATQIAQKTCKRVYYALLEGNLKEETGRVVTDIGRHPTDRLKQAVLPSGEGKTAITDYQTVVHFGTEFTLCRFSLQTGRTHQIRVHAKHLGCPVAGDMLYGFKKPKLAPTGQLLHAYKLQLTHPTTGEEMSFVAPLPTAFLEILQKLARKHQIDESVLNALIEQ
jgi:23S rRNA pseudouridine1911/1915/1917 synthase